MRFSQIFFALDGKKTEDDDDCVKKEKQFMEKYLIQAKKIIAREKTTQRTMRMTKIFNSFCFILFYILFYFFIFLYHQATPFCIVCTKKKEK